MTTALRSNRSARSWYRSHSCQNNEAAADTHHSTPGRHSVVARVSDGSGPVPRSNTHSGGPAARTGGGGPFGLGDHETGRPLLVGAVLEFDAGSLDVRLDRHRGGPVTDVRTAVDVDAPSRL